MTRNDLELCTLWKQLGACRRGFFSRNVPQQPRLFCVFESSTAEVISLDGVNATIFRIEALTNVEVSLHNCADFYIIIR